MRLRKIFNSEKFPDLRYVDPSDSVYIVTIV